MSELFPGRRGHAPPGDALGRVYTPRALADAIVGAVDERFQVYDARIRTAIEPSVGEGAFARALRARLPSVHITGVDLDPAAAGLALCDDAVVGDWPAQSWEESDDLCIGNPPYHTSRKNGRPGVPWPVPVSHTLAAIQRARAVALIFPVVYACCPTFRDEVPPPVLWPILRRPWSRVREVALFTWGLGVEPVDIRW